MKKILTVLCLAVMLAVMLIPTAVLADATVWVKTGNGGALNARERPDKGSTRVASLPYRTQLTVHPATSSDGWSVNGWCLVSDPSEKYFKGDAFVMASFLSFTDPGPYGSEPGQTGPTYQDVDSACKALRVVTPYRAVITTSRPTNYVHLRWIPNTSARFIDKYLCNTQILVLAESKTWAQVQIVDSGYVGFILKSCVNPIPQ